MNNRVEQIIADIERAKKEDRAEITYSVECAPYAYYLNSTERKTIARHTGWICDKQSTYVTFYDGDN